MTKNNLFIFLILGVCSFGCLSTMAMEQGIFRVYETEDIDCSGDKKKKECYYNGQDEIKIDTATILNLTEKANKKTNNQVNFLSQTHNNQLTQRPIGVFGSNNVENTNSSLSMIENKKILLGFDIMFGKHLIKK